MDHDRPETDPQTGPETGPETDRGVNDHGVDNQVNNNQVNNRDVSDHNRGHEHHPPENHRERDENHRERDEAGFYSGPEHQPFEIGTGARGVLLVHGFPGTPAELRPLGEALAALGYHVRAPLLPGFGRDIVRLGEVAYPAWVQAVRDAWRTLCSESDEAVLLGYSMGAAVALAVAAEISAEAADDSLPDHLVLIAPFWQLGDWRASLLPLVKLVKPRLKPFENADFSDPAVRDQFTRILPDADLDDPAVQQRLRDEIVLPTSAIDELRKLGKHAAKAAPDVTVPTLVVQGRGDTTVAARDTRTLATKLGGRLTLAEVEAPHELIYPGVDGFSDLTAILEGYLSAK